MKSGAPKAVSPISPNQQFAGFLAKFEPATAKLIRQCRAAMRKLVPSANELVYDNYNFFVIGYSTTERASDCMFSIAAGANGVGLSFYHGASLPDPQGLLLGNGKQNRFVRLPSVETLRAPGILALIVAAVAHAQPPLSGDGSGRMIIKSVSARHRHAAKLQNPPRSLSKHFVGVCASNRGARARDRVFDQQVARRCPLYSAGCRLYSGGCRRHPGWASPLAGTAPSRFPRISCMSSV